MPKTTFYLLKWDCKGLGFRDERIVYGLTGFGSILCVVSVFGFGLRRLLLRTFGSRFGKTVAARRSNWTPHNLERRSRGFAASYPKPLNPKPLG